MKEVLKLCKHTFFDVLAHSNGGWALLELMAHDESLVFSPSGLRRLVFTDSYHNKSQLDRLGPRAKALIGGDECINFVPHNAPLGTPVRTWVSLRNTLTVEGKGCHCVSSAVEDHAATSSAVIAEAFDFFAATPPCVRL